MLTYLGQVAKRKSRFEERAADLVKANPGVEKLEEEMRDRTHGIVARLSRGKMRFTEFERVAADDTITAALAGIMLGDGRNSKLKDQTFASATRTMPYLWEFYREILFSLNEGDLGYEDDDKNPPPIMTADAGRSPSKYARHGYSPTDPEVLQDMIDIMPTRVPELGKSRPKSWDGVEFRLGNYTAAPVYSWYTKGDMASKQRTGFKEMKRDCVCDKRTCKDCRSWASLGWQPIGTLPLPGDRCQCLFNCRCALDYR
jgi:hypothetical protein